MARGAARAPSQNAYRGSIGRTQTETVHVTGPRGDLIVGTVYTTIDAVSDPELVERLHADDPARALNVIRVEAEPESIRVAVPVIYHDPAAEVLVLVLGEAHRHREIEERIRLLERLRDDDAAIPAYVKDFAVVFGSAGLRAHLEYKAQQVLESVDKDRGRIEIDRLRNELERGKAELLRDRAELERTRQASERERQEVERARADVRARVIASVQVPAEQTTIGPPPSAPDDLITKPVLRPDVEDIIARAREDAASTQPRSKSSGDFDAEIPTGVEHQIPVGLGQKPTNGVHKRTPVDAAKVEFDEEETTGTSIVPQGSDPLTTETFDIKPANGKPDAWLEFAATGATSSFGIQDGKARLALITGDAIARGLAGHLDVRVLLHRLPTYPVVTFVIGPPAALRVPSQSQLAVIPLDIGVDLERSVLNALAKSFELTIDIITHGVPARRVKLVAPLAENVAYILRAADDHLRGLTADGEAEPSFSLARDLVLGAGYDFLGQEHSEQSEFRDDKLAQLDTAQALRRAIAMARRFARPSREDYLVCARGFPLSRWRELRRHVLESAVAWGIWMGPELAQVAVSEGLARSRRDLIMKLDAGFDALRRHETAFDIDADAAEDNLTSIAEEARALGVEIRRKSNGAIKSEEHSVVSGSIERTPPAQAARPKPIDELIALLDDKKHRIAAALELCDRGDPRAAAPVVNAVKKMSRAEAVRVLGKTVKLGAAAAPPLVEGLGSSKAYLRHGCALALGLLRTDEGTHAVIEVLITEPTEIWREIARAIGQIGPTALMPLASHVGRLGDKLTPQVQERVSWAAAHIGVRGGKTALEQMAAGQSVMAPIAKLALGLLSTAAQDEVRVRPDQPGRDVTVNRAFSRRFFEAIEAGNPAAAQALHDLETSSPMEMLDDSDLIAEEEDEAELDESDLIQT
ncbi:MAG: Methyltransferase type 11 [Myxococcales bacterium]|nr:Methyltransferase type 11 [Myxococcales bacterium]